MAGKKGRGGWSNSASANNGKSGGRPRVTASFRRGEVVIIHRTRVGDVSSEEQGLVLSTGRDELEIQIGEEILVVRRGVEFRRKIMTTTPIVKNFDALTTTMRQSLATASKRPDAHPRVIDTFWIEVDDVGRTAIMYTVDNGRDWKDSGWVIEETDEPGIWQFVR